MPSKENAPELLLERLKTLDSWLASKTNLFDGRLQESFHDEISALEKNIQDAREKARKLRIGIIGQVKAGKSSFLNTVIFDGEQVLPKAATPMTAALTKLSYSEIPKAVVHYYSQAEWSSLEEANREFEARLEEAYEKYKREQEQVQEQVPDEKPKRNLLSKISSSNANQKKLLKKEEYEKIFREGQSKRLQAGRELVGMVTDRGILSKIDTEEELEGTSTGNLMETLKEYVGAGGEYTPIVSYVELLLPEEQLRDLTIIDTPGLNDPIRSREYKTQKFLRECDVTFLLSPCSQFMDEATIELMDHHMPDAGIQKIVVVGSKLDSGVCNCKGKNMSFREAWGSSVRIYLNTFGNNIKLAEQRAGNNRGVIATIRKNKEQPIFFSAMCYQIDKILKSGKAPAPGTEEEKSYENLQLFAGFQDDALFTMSGVQKIKDSIQKVLESKEELIAGKNGTFCESAWQNALALLNQIQNNAIQNRERLNELSEDSLQELEERYKLMAGILNSSRIKISALFEIAGNDAEKSANRIRNECGNRKSDFVTLKPRVYTHEIPYDVSEWFGLVKRHYTTIEKTEVVKTSQVETNINKYTACCNEIVDNRFSLLFNQEKLERQLRKAIIEACEQSNCQDNYDNIEPQLRMVLSKISTPPQFSIDSSEVIDKLERSYPYGMACDDDISKLEMFQTKLLNDIARKVEEQINSAVREIKHTMTAQAATFADIVAKGLEAEKKKLKDQLKDKKAYLQKFDDFIPQLAEEKIRLGQENFYGGQ